MKTQQSEISEVSLIYRTKVKASDRPQIKCSKDAFDLFMETWDLDTIEHHEEFKLMLLTSSKRVPGIASISKGGINGTVTDVRIVNLREFHTEILPTHVMNKKFHKENRFICRIMRRFN